MIHEIVKSSVCSQYCCMLEFCFRRKNVSKDTTHLLTIWIKLSRLEQNEGAIPFGAQNSGCK